MREVLIAGLAARQRADETLRAGLMADVGATVADEARIGSIKNAIVGFRRDALRIDPASISLQIPVP